LRRCGLCNGQLQEKTNEWFECRKCGSVSYVHWSYRTFNSYYEGLKGMIEHDKLLKSRGLKLRCK